MTSCSYGKKSYETSESVCMQQGTKCTFHAAMLSVKKCLICTLRMRFCYSACYSGWEGVLRVVSSLKG